MNKGQNTYLAIFVVDPSFTTGIGPLTFMGSYEGTALPLDFMATFGTSAHGQGKCVVFDSLCDFGYNMKSGAKLNIQSYGDSDNYGNTDDIVTIEWSIDGLQTNADRAIIEALKNQTKDLYIFDPLLNRVEKLEDAIIRTRKTTEGNKKEVFSFYAERYGTKSQFYEEIHLAT